MSDAGSNSLPRLRGRVRVGATSSRENMRGGLPKRNQARNLRRNMTDAEQALWRELRRNRFGWRFRRQFPIPPYIVDFACLEARLIVEADGGQHAQPSDHDRRDAALRAEGWRVLRFWNNDILENRAGVLRQSPMRSEIGHRYTPTPTLPRKRGREFRLTSPIPLLIAPMRVPASG